MLTTALVIVAPIVGDEPPLSGNTTAPLAPAEQKIRDALDGKRNGPTGDGVLDDVLGLIKSQGSILDGSVLDHEPLQPPAKSITAQRVSFVVEERAETAESLLRTARLLVKLGPMDETRAELVAKMRREAVRILTE